MTHLTSRRLGMVALFLVAVGLLAGAVWRYGYVQALAQLEQRGYADLTLATDRLLGQLQLYQQLAVLTADHPTIYAVLEGAPVGSADTLLLQAADKTAALELFLVSPKGLVVASAHGHQPGGLAEAPYFKRALQGALGEGPGLNLQTGQRAYYFAAPVHASGGGVLGVLVVVANIDKVEFEWRGARPAIFISDDQHRLFISNRSELLLWRQIEPGLLLSPGGARQGFEQWQVGGHQIWLSDWSPYLPRRALHLSQDLPGIAMQAEALIDVDPARRLAGLQAAVVAALCLVFGAFWYLATERRRTLAEANAKLESRVSARTRALSEANEALQKAQADLVQAGKLSALGQMSAGISHELNQPLMAIQQYAENGALFLQRGKPEGAAQNLDRVSALARRMARIIKNLRAFARQESEPSTVVDLTAVIRSALELSEVRLKQEEISLDWSPPQGPIWVTGGEVRLTQVLVNLIGNAADAMAGRSDKRIDLQIRQEDAKTFLDVGDSGPGIKEPEKIFDPFYTTKEVGGDGMGLGLSISYGLVQSFGGAIRGRNRPEGGAIFTVELARVKEGIEG